MLFTIFFAFFLPRDEGLQFACPQAPVTLERRLLIVALRFTHFSALRVMHGFYDLQSI